MYDNTLVYKPTCSAHKKYDGIPIAKLEMLPEAEFNGYDVGQMYRITFENGDTVEAFGDELSVK